MIQEALQYIAELGRSSKEVELVNLPGNKMLVVTPDGATQELQRDRKTQHDKLASFASLLEWSQERDNTDLVFEVSNSGIKASDQRNDPHLSDTADFQFLHSAAFSDLRDWIGSPRGVKPLVRGLRGKLHNTFDPAYLSVFKRLDFTRRNDGSRGTSHTGESMGKSVEMAAQSASGEIPEMLVFGIRLFSNVPIESYDLRVAVDVNAENEQVAIMEVGDCIEEAHRQTREELASRLKAEFPNSLVIETV